ncbi:MAG: bifunctional 5,10-methylene-tetrahydrofolate dehydrogenase/5,10-methylene-tetrahydrofolate cyclohydrolase [Candidatus Omnitrophica bacterium CG08_land_8_20_14_0_20_41_16]|uniref:Bifunctional protein FolD n=1 Tax=Candidatus Sherwoodlollariibacterium unditelluris TaxID=1974757 RepID=A0A2G9YKK9_9BACT|nr:MAG: bifunctional 5,10-methylene-tetrahydrofolate dehydrogenase/5,10-methylene-tetrahydrofolate cyclohydrolase [Candidatus Omnitrophica bacterium CG23_combo_of_CG06-09_8_20_14_all_41_10]PIS33720.1 MAG: bifunctional 5,10-methylene-tetrahydrofolate dehydrogenase/5,10-methylene-tetrahydrofolate cyclohydrolase [Candidatus Omnitrophica bacterium CG08_land_8_20_14_0_20_41_16]
MAKLLEGKPIAEKIKEEIKQEVQALKHKPVLASIMAGENAGAVSYVKSQTKVAENLGIEYKLHNLAQDTSEATLIDFIKKLNADKSVNGIIIQMPLPAQIDYKKISQFILPEKDVEGMHPVNIGKIVFGKAKILPCTAAAVMELLKETGVDLYGKEAVVVGHSEIVGKPLSLLLLDKFATVTVCHIGTSKAGKLEEHVRTAEILIVAVGKAGLIKGDWVKEGAIVIDVGINRVADKIVGDLEFEPAEKHASWITPVPGGVGPLTVTMLMRNLVEAAKLQQ